MSSRRNLGLVAAAATLLASVPLSTVFDTFTWLFQCMVVVGAVAGTAYAVRSLRGRSWAQLSAMTVALLVALTLVYGGGTALLGLIPTPQTLARFAALITDAGALIRSSSVPAPDLEPLLFVTALGIGAVAIGVDAVAVIAHRPAVAGLPMLAVYSVPVAIYTESVSAIPFAIGALGFLWLLVSDNVDRVRRFGRRFTGEGRGVDVWEPSPLAAAGRRLAVAGVAVAVLIPVLIPGMTSGFFERFGSGEGEGAGPPGQGRGAVNLFAELTGQLNQTGVLELVRVTTDDPSPFYMKFGVADDVNDQGFRNRMPAGAPVDNNLPQAVDLVKAGVTTTRHTARVEVSKDFQMPLLPVYTMPAGIRGLDSSWAYDPDMQLVFSQRSSSAGRRYDFDFLRPQFTVDALRTAQPLPPGHPVQRQFTRVPSVPEVEKKVADLVKKETGVYEKVRAIYDYFSASNGFRYDLNAPPGTSNAAIIDFLTSKKGFCVQYAAALTWMVRTAGVPARVAFGFTKGSDYADNTYVLTNKNLHAWTEVYFDGFGWVPFDATPAASVSGSVSTGWAPDVNAPEQTPTEVGPSLSPGADGGEDPRAGIDRNGPNDGGTGLDGAGGGSRTPAWVWWSIALVVLLVVVLVSPALRRVTLRRRRGIVPPGVPSAAAEAGDPAPGTVTVVAAQETDLARRQAHAVWDELMDTLVDFRVPLDAALTPRSTAERLIRDQRFPEPLAQHTRLIGRAEERARYAPVPLVTDGLQAALAAIRKALAADASLRVRWAATLLPPSVTQRWRRTISAFTTRTVIRTSQLSEALVSLGRPLSPRRLFRSRRAAAGRRP